MLDLVGAFLEELWPKIGAILAAILFAAGVVVLLYVLGQGGAPAVQNGVGTLAVTLPPPP